MAPFDEHMKLFEYAFNSTGYKMEFVQIKGGEAIDEAEARRRIIASIDAGRPVMSHGIVGPPETCLITGYDDGGDVVIGWSFFQYGPETTQGVEFEPNGMFRKRDWYPAAWDLFALGERGEPVDPKTVRRRSLEWAVKVVRTKETRDGRTNNGLAAYDAWIEHLLRDEDITPDGAAPEGSPDSPFSVHDDAVGTLAEGRHYAGEYLKRIAQEEPSMAPHLLEAADCYKQIHDLMWKVWGCVGGNGRSPEHVRAFADPDARRRIVELLREAKRLDEQAIEDIEAALEADDQAMAVPDAELVMLDELIVMGIKDVVQDGGEVRGLWQRDFTDRMGEIKPHAAIPERYYGLSYQVNGEHVYFAGMVVDPPADVPDGLVLGKIPAGRYVKFDGPFHEWWMRGGDTYGLETWFETASVKRDFDREVRSVSIFGMNNRTIFLVPAEDDTTHEPKPYRLSKPVVIERDPTHVVGMVVLGEGNEEPWGETMKAFDARKADIPNRVGDTQLAFLYRPSKDDPAAPEDARGCFIGYETANGDHVPEGMSHTRFSAGYYVTLTCSGEREMDAAMGVGDAVQTLEAWARTHGFTEGDACFCLSHDDTEKPPYVQHVLMKIGH